MRGLPVVLACLIMVFTGFNSLVQASHEITRWKGGHAATVSLTYDDGYDNHATIAGVLLNQRNLKGSFYIRTDWLETSEDWEMWQELAAQGHEIGSHSVNHPEFTALTEAELRYELSQSKAEIQLNIPAQSCLTIAYPDGFQDPFIESVVSEYYIAGRSIHVPATGYVNYYPGEGYPGVNFYRIASKRFDEKPVGDIIEEVDLALATNAWLSVHNHDIHGEYAGSLAALYDYILAGDVWVAPVESVVRYMRERMNGTVTVYQETSDRIELGLTTSSLDTCIYDLPLTVRSTVPSDWYGVYVRQGSTSDEVYSVVESGEERVVYYDAKPDSNMIELSKSPALECIDMDHDGHGNPARPSCLYSQLDCNDSNPDINPHMPEIPGNGIDEDCHPATPAWLPASLVGVEFKESSDIANYLLVLVVAIGAVSALRIMPRRK